MNADRDESDSINAMIIQAAGGSGSLENPYKDVPKQIGWGTTISAPSMHAETLQYLHNKLSTAHTVLDIGTGSGFITAAMAQLIPDQGTVYAVDHIKEINDFAESNIKKVCPHLIRKKKVAFITQDGRKGLPTYQGNKMQYDVIHVGGQLNEVEE